MERPLSLAEALRVAQGASSMIIKSSGASGETAFGEHTGINQVKIGQFVVPTDAEAAMWLRDTGAVESRMLPAWKVMDGSIAPERLEGAIVFIGTSAAGLKDQHSTPLDQATTGVSLHAQMVEQILLNDFLERPDWADGVETVGRKDSHLSSAYLGDSRPGRVGSLLGGGAMFKVSTVV